MLDEGEVAFAVTVPVNFARDLVRGQTPQLLIQADASDPAASSIALATISELAESALKDDLVGPLASRANKPAFTAVIHRRYNPEGITQYNIVPGLIARHPHHDHGDGHRDGDDARAREGHVREPARDAGEPVRGDDRQDHALCRRRLYPGDADPPAARYFVFNVPMIGSLTLLAATVGLFIAANLALGFTFSTIAKNQLQAMQMTVFFLLPSILLSGFMFPFRGMPNWAQWVGEALPNTHFLRIVRGILLKGNGPARNLAPCLAAADLPLRGGERRAMLRYRRTLD